MKTIFSRQLIGIAALAGLSLTVGCLGNGAKNGKDVDTAESPETGVTVSVIATQPDQSSQQSSEVSVQPVKSTSEPSAASVPTDKSSASTSSVQSDKTSPQISGTPAESVQKIVLLNNQKDLLRLNIHSDGGNADEKTLVTDFIQRIQGALSSNDAKIVTDGKYDVRVVIRPKLTVVDQDGDYFRMNCTVGIEMKSADGRRIFGTKAIEVSTPQRVLGKNTAIARLATSASDNAADWCRTELKRITTTEVGAALLSIQLPAAPEGKKRNAQNDTANFKSIGDAIAKLPGIVNYELVGQNLQNGTCQYRVVYFISAFPNGIANEISVQINTIKLK